MHEPTNAPASAHSAKSRRASDLLACLVLTLIASLVCWPWLFGGQSFYGGDFGSYFWPNAHLAGASLRDGILPLWNPYLLCGTPLISNPQASLLYPVNVLHFVLSPSRFLMADMALHLLLAGCGGYLLLRRGLLALKIGPALLGATALMFNGFFVAKMQFPNMIQALAYVPLLLFLTEKVVQRPGERRFVLALSVALALQILASNAQITVFSGYLMIAVALHSWLRRSAGSPPASAVLGRFASAGILALALSCAAWLPVFELLRVASRQSLDLVQANRFYLPPGEITNLFWPHRFGDLMQNEPWTAIGDYVETACYAGVLPCLLALAGISAGVRRRAGGGLFWVYVLVFSLWLSLGIVGLLYIPAFFLVPGLNRFHDAVRLLLGAAIALPVLAAIGLQVVCGRLALARTYGRRACVFLGLVAACLTACDQGGFTRNFYAVKPAVEVEAMSRAPEVELLKRDPPLAGGSGRILSLTVKEDPPIPNHGGSPFAMADKTYLPRWAATLRPNLASTASLRDATGYEPFSRRDSRERVARAKRLLAAPVSAVASREAAAALSALSVRLVSFIGTKPLPPHDFLRLEKTTPLVPGLFQYFYYNQNYTPRARLSSGQVPGIQRDEPNVVEIAIPAALQAQTLNLADTPHPGWHAYLDGKEVAWQARDSLRVVEIPPAGKTAGQHKLSFVFAPETFRLGLFISLCSLAALATCISSRPKCR